MAMQPRCARGQVRVRACGMLLKAVRESELQAALEVVPALVIAAVDARSAEVVERMTEDICVAAGLCKADRALCPIDRRLSTVGEHLELRAIAVRHRKLRAPWQRVEHCHGLGGIALGIRAAPAEPTQSR